MGNCVCPAAAVEEETNREERTFVSVSSVQLQPFGENFDLENLFPNFPSHITECFKFWNELGRGGYGRVWKVKDKRDRKFYACKVIEKSRLKLKNIQSLSDEVTFMTKLRHKGMPKFIEGYETKEKVYIVTELLEGGELLERVLDRRKKLSQAGVADVLKQICEVIRYFHSKKCVHCDLKPENILYRKKDSDELVIIDFGLSKVQKRFRWQTSVGGTPSYIAPECLLGIFDYQVDMWAIGIIAFELLHGYLPFKQHKQNKLDTIKETAKGFKNEVKEGRGPWFNKKINISANARDFIQMLLKSEPSERMTAVEACAHPFLQGNENESEATMILRQNLTQKFHHNTLKRMVKDLIQTSEVPENLLSQIHKLFAKYSVEDSEGKRVMNWENFVELCNTLANNHLDKDRVKEIFDFIDKEHKMQIREEDFIPYCYMQHCAQQDDRIYDLVVHHLDPDFSGRINIKDVTSNYEKVTNRRLSPKSLLACEELGDEDGKVGYLEFLKHLESLEDIELGSDQKKIKVMRFQKWKDAHKQSSDSMGIGSDIAKLSKQPDVIDLKQPDETESDPQLENIKNPNSTDETK